MAHPHDESHIVLMPATPLVMREKAPGMFRIFVWKENTQSVFVCKLAGAVVMSPDYAKEEGSRGGHDGDVWEEPGTVVSGEGVNDFKEERVVGDAAHYVV